MTSRVMLCLTTAATAAGAGCVVDVAAFDHPAHPPHARSFLRLPEGVADGFRRNLPGLAPAVLQLHDH